MPIKSWGSLHTVLPMGYAIPHCFSMKKFSPINIKGRHHYSFNYENFRLHIGNKSLLPFKNR